jgi:hypothetical protein
MMIRVGLPLTRREALSLAQASFGRCSSFTVHGGYSGNQRTFRAGDRTRDCRKYTDILLTSIVSLLAAIIGGWIAAKYALRAQKQAAEDQRRRDVEAEHRTTNSTLQAIATELTVLKADF